jgi:hypothetical protein
MGGSPEEGSPEEGSMTRYNITILHGYEFRDTGVGEELTLIFPYGQPDDQFVLGDVYFAEYAYETDNRNWDKLWRENNAVTGDPDVEYPVLKQTRSLSVGDIVVVRDQISGAQEFIYVAPFGVVTLDTEDSWNVLIRTRWERRFAFEEVT